MRCLTMVWLFFGLGLMLTGQADASHIYWTTGFGQSVERANLDGTGRQAIVSGSNITHGIALDLKAGIMYWTGVQSRGIWSANIDGSNAKLLLRPPRDPTGIALDTIHGNIYWAQDPLSPSWGNVMQASIDGTNSRVAVSLDQGYPIGLAVDPVRGYIYWTNTYLGTINRASLDGTEPIRLVNTGISPIDLDIDFVNGKMYWTENGQSNESIRRANLDGSGIENLVISGLDNPLGIALDIAAGKMYWADLGYQRIGRANLDGSGVEYILSNLGMHSPEFIALDVPVPPEPSTLMLLGLVWMLAINRRR